VETGELDAVVLAWAGLARIGRLDAVTEVFDTADMVPAPGQGALAVECRADRPGLAEMLARVDDRATRAAVTAERAVLAGLQAGCSAPVGAYAAGTGVLHLAAVVLGDGTEPAIRVCMSAPSAEAQQLGWDAARELLRRGAGKYMSMTGVHSSNGDDAM
jgi:hydroxymethylbilane synthase